MDNNNQKNEMAGIAHSIGKLSGELSVMHKSITDSISVLRADMHRMQTENRENMENLEERVNKKIDSVGNRVKSLEDEDKKLIEKVAKLSVWGGGVSGALAAGIVELIKRL